MAEKELELDPGPMTIKIYCKDGKEVHEFKYKKGNYECLPCQSTLPSQESMIVHIKDKRHVAEMLVASMLDELGDSNAGHYSPKRNKAASYQGIQKNKIVKAREPLTDDNNLSKSDIFSEYKKAALIGIEFLAEVKPACQQTFITFPYYCLLCDSKAGNMHNVVQHLVGKKHRMQYLKLYFPHTYKGLTEPNPRMTVHDRANLVLEGVVSAIEFDFGRLSPVAVPNADLENDKDAVFQRMLEEKHFDEKDCEYKDLVARLIDRESRTYSREDYFQSYHKESKSRRSRSALDRLGPYDRPASPPREVKYSRWDSGDRVRRPKSDESDDEIINESKVIHVLGLLAALETQLDSLAPLVMTVLAEAVALEQQSKGGASTLLCHKECISLLNDVKEKLQGQLSADIEDGRTIIAMKRTIKAIKELLKSYDEKKKKNLLPRPVDNKQVVSLIAKAVNAELAKYRLQCPPEGATAASQVVPVGPGSANSLVTYFEGFTYGNYQKLPSIMPPSATYCPSNFDYYCD